MRICLQCPWCTFTTSPEDGFCCDAEGVSSEVEGGSTGQCLNIIGTSEFQKKRDEHIHFEAVVECLHTGRSLHDIAGIIEKGFAEIVHGYKAYANHVCVQGYRDASADPAAKQISAEATWPAHAGSRRLAAIPKYFGIRPGPGLSLGELLVEGRKWQQLYHDDLDYVIEKRQEHVCDERNGFVVACSSDIVELARISISQ